MDVTLKIFFALKDDRPQFDFNEHYDYNKELLKKVFAAGLKDEDIDVNIINEVGEMVLDYNYLKPVTQQLLFDINCRESYIYRLFQENFSGDDLERRADVFLMLFEICCREWKKQGSINQNTVKYEVYYHRTRNVYFPIHIPKSLLEERFDESTFYYGIGPMRIFLWDFTKEEIAKYFIYSYMRELAAHDRGFVRDDKEEMSHLREHWIEDAMISLG